MTGLVLDTKLTAKQRRHLELSKTSAESLLVLLDDILDFSKIEAGRLDLAPSPFALRSLLAQIMPLQTLQADAKGLSIVCDVAPTVPDTLVGDAGRLKQVLGNLLSNAVKFTLRGGVRLRWKAASEAGVGEHD